MNQYKKQAIELRNAGYSYNMIRQKLGISKSTLSNWLNGIPFVPNQEVLSRVGEAKLKSGLRNHHLKLENIVKMRQEAKEEIGNLTQRDMFMLGIGLYLGEGSKSHEDVKIVNSNPVVMKLAMKWLQNFTPIKGHNLRVSIHGYPDHNPDELLHFWSGALELPFNQFIKVSIDTRPNKLEYKQRKLPYGTAHLYVRGGGTLSLGVKNLHRKIMGWIDASMEQI